MNSEEIIKLVEIKGKLDDVVTYVNTLSYSPNLFNHVNVSLELLKALIADLDTKLTKDAEEKKATEEKTEKDKSDKKKVKVN